MVSRVAPRALLSFVAAALSLAPALAHADEATPDGGVPTEEAPLTASDVKCEALLPKLEAAYAEAPTPTPALLDDLGRCREDVGDWVGAASARRRSLAEAGPALGEEGFARASEALARIEAKLARVLVASDVEGLEVRVDGRCATDATTYEPACVSRGTERVVLVNPGERRLTVAHAGYREVSRTLTLAPGESVRVRVDATRRDAHENPFREPMWTAWAVTAGAGLATGILGARTAIAGDGLDSGPGIVAITLGAGTLVAAGVAAYFTVRGARWRPPAAVADGLLLRARF